ncbi:hypothetical protein [Paenibacillus sp. UASWS1643]|uniref:hypothetical protein n=1 Tax=Paenibacillus sp. UASWS1643 TaxID=2580422 RepID=UPI00123AE8B8|nr:hypothetical protein [Paenibacillus sp. UASWS1643]KAA8745558.1 hypothetical protein FE296_27255 [Paenibacillus sp. UASWS1643]
MKQIKLLLNNDETIKVLGTDTDEVLVEEAKIYRNNPGPNEGVFVTHLNDTMKSDGNKFLSFDKRLQPMN